MEKSIVRCRSGGSGLGSRASRYLLLAMAGIFVVGCSVAPIKATVPDDLPPRTFLLLRATIVDVDVDAAKLTVKDDSEHETWTVAVVEETRILGGNGDILALGELPVGRKVQIRGWSRIENLLTALEVNEIAESP